MNYTHIASIADRIKHSAFYGMDTNKSLFGLKVSGWLLV